MRGVVTTEIGAIHLAPTMRGQLAERGIPATTAGTARTPVEATATVRWTCLRHLVLPLTVPIKSVHFTNQPFASMIYVSRRTCTS